MSGPQQERKPKLTPASAVAALILVEGTYLLQLRDAKAEIFFPGQWGCFGGAMEKGETEDGALARELHEELAIELQPRRLTYFTRFTIDFGFAGHGEITRSFYEVHLSARELERLQLGEGAALRTFSATALLGGEVPLTPFDSFALWLHVNRDRLSR